MTMSMPTRRGLGVTAGVDEGLAHNLAVSCERLGYHSLWSNDEAASPGLETLAQFADAAGHAAPVVAAYVRVAVGSGSLQRLRDEESHYRTINDRHRKHFEAMNVPLGSVGVAASARSEVLEQLVPYQAALDLPIARLLAEHDTTSLNAAAGAAAP